MRTQSRGGLWRWWLLAGLLLTSGVGHAAPMTLTLAWDAPTDTVGGIALTNAIGFKLYRGHASRVYDHVQNVGYATQVDVAGLDDSVSYSFAVTAYDASGRESVYSEEFRWFARVPAAINRLALSTNALQLNAIAGVGGPAQTIHLRSLDGPVTYTILDAPSWLHCDPRSGTLASAPAEDVLTVSVGRLAPGRYAATLSIGAAVPGEARTIQDVRLTLDVHQPDAQARDTDGDGLDDVGELLVGTHPERRDSDGDGLDDRSELLCGTDPWDSAAVLAVNGVMQAGAMAALSWPAKPGVTYAVDVSRDLVHWRLAPQGLAADEQSVRVAATGGVLTYRDATGAAQGAYYRLRVPAPP